MKTMKTMKRQRRMGSIWVFFGMVFAFSLVMSGASFGDTHDLICWKIDTSTCNTLTGDCAFKSEGDKCVRCLGANPLWSACIFNPDTNCQIAGNATPVDCGDQREGKCNNGLCDGNINRGRKCLVWQCSNPVPGNQ